MLMSEMQDEIGSSAEHWYHLSQHYCASAEWPGHNIILCVLV